MVKLITEMLKEIEDSPTKLSKTEIIDKYCGIYPGFILFMRYLYKDDVKWAITDIPIYTPSIKPLGANSYLIKEIRTMYVFLSETKLPNVRRAALLIQLLECLDVSDAQLVEKLIQKQLNISGFTAKDWNSYEKIKFSGGHFKDIKEDIPKIENKKIVDDMVPIKQKKGNKTKGKK